MGITKLLRSIQEVINVADVVLSLDDLENIFWFTVMRIMKYADSETNQDKVRISWPKKGSPSWKISEDVCFIRINDESSPVSEQRDVNYSVKDTDNAVLSVGYTKYHAIQFTLYGPNSYERADLIKYSLLLPEHKDTFAQNNLYIVPPVSTPKRNPELYDGQWWNRVDLVAGFNEAVIRESDIPLIKRADIQIKESR